MCVAVCCGVLQCVAVCCCALQCVAVQFVAQVCWIRLDAVHVCCSVLQCVAVCCVSMQTPRSERGNYFRFLDYCVLQCILLQLPRSHRSAKCVKKELLLKRDLNMRGGYWYTSQFVCLGVVDVEGGYWYIWSTHMNASWSRFTCECRCESLLSHWYFELGLLSHWFTCERKLRFLSCAP